MGTTTKALKLLEHFTAAEPELGLSALARRAKVEKATTYRLMSELCAAGFVEQNQRSKLYRLGPSFIRYANLREQTFPAKRAAAEHLDRLVNDIHETAHVTELQGTMLSPVHCREAVHHRTRVSVDPTELLPLYATSSGKVVLAFSDDSLLEKVLAAPMSNPSGKGAIDVDVLLQQVQEARRTGFGRTHGDYEKDLSSIAAPLFASNGLCVGAVSVVCPSSRMTSELQSRTEEMLKTTARAITQIWGGDLPQSLQKAWEETAHA